MTVSAGHSSVLSTLGTPFGIRPPLEAKSPPLTTHNRQIDNIIFDFGDVLFTWSANTGTSISPKTLHSVLRSVTWFEYEKGNLDEDETYRLAAAEFSLDSSELGATFRVARESLQSDPSMITLLHELKGKFNIRLFAMSNISAPDWEVLRHKARPEDWALFERVFTSAAARERKPNLGFFRHVLESAGIDPRRTAFVDDKLENVISARSLGLKGIVFTSFDEVACELRALVRDPVVDGERYLRDHAKEMKSVTSTGHVLEENFVPLLILEATGDPSLVDYIKYPRLSNFFKSEPILTTDTFPCDLDTTSVACTVSDHFSPEVKNDIMNEILTFKNMDGIIQTYFDATRPRIGTFPKNTIPIVCVNVLTFFYSNGRGGELPETFDWVCEVLKNRAYMDGTTYYCGADTFLYFLSRLLSVSIYARQQIGQLFTKRIAEHFGGEGDALALAMRIHAAAVVDLCDSRDYERLRRMQEADGSWPLAWMLKYGASGVVLGNKGLTTAFAVSAMRNYNELERRLRSFE
ncbi:HAD-like protein [Butyriboletus roseoflavus]|nr:HAD-like protein [Butyriboletus roseoflavus]